MNSIDSRRAIGIAVLAMLIGPPIAAPASGQVSVLSRTGPTVQTFSVSAGGPAFVGSVDVAYDPEHGVFLAVASGDGRIWGAFVDAQGNATGPIFRIDANNDPALAAGSVVMSYSPHVSDGAGGTGGFLVVWSLANQVHEVATLRGRIVAFPGTLVGAETTLPATGIAELAYSPSSKVFLSVVKTTQEFLVIRLGLDGVPIGQPGSIGTSFGALFSPVAWNSNLDEFGVFFHSADRVTTFARIGADGAVIRRTQLVVGPLPYDGSLAFNPHTGNFVVVWDDGVPPAPSAPFGLFAAEISGAGDVLGSGHISYLTTRGFGLTVSYSPVSQTFLVAAPTFFFGSRALELNGHGAPASTLTNFMGQPASQFRAAPRPDIGAWLIVAVTNFSPNQGRTPLGLAQPLVTSSSNGGSTWTIPTTICPGAGPPPGGLQCINGQGFAEVDAPLVAPPPAPVPSDATCSTTDPFVTLGGGTCVSGNWFPPGMPIPSAPAPQPPPPPAPPGGCAIPDPFVSLGGGTCVNGDWFPPGMAIPGVPSPPPAPPPSPGGCPGSDPFLGLPGLAGVCINGDWIPTELLQTAATVRVHTVEGGFWALDLDDGRFLVPLNGLPTSFRIEGLRVTFTGKVRSDLLSVQGVIVEVLSIS